MKCNVCSKGKLVERSIDKHDASALFGLEHVVLRGARGLVCNHCGEAMLDGAVIDTVEELLTLFLASQRGALNCAEFRFLRKSLRLTQQQLAEAMGVDRVSINRWENGAVPLGRLESMALRALVMVAHESRRVKSVAAKFVDPGAGERHGPYEINLAAA